MRTIRSRIALWAFGVLLLLIGLQSGLVLRGLEGALREVADRELRSDLDALARSVADGRLVELQRAAANPDTNLSDLIFEIRDVLEERGRSQAEGLLYVIHRESDRIAGSEELALDFAESASAPAGGGVTFRDAPDPRRPGSGQQLRVASLELGAYQLEVARTLNPFADIYRATRTQLFVILALVSCVGALGAYWIARRALTPVRQLVDEAKRLRTLSEGNLPRTGRADEIDDLAEVFNGLLDRIRADVLRIQRFTADAAHEIRTPLAAIRGHLELMLEKVDPDAQSGLTTVLEEVERLSRMVNQLLMLEALQKTPDPAERKRMDLGELAGQLVEHLRVLAEAEGIDLVGDFGPAPVLGDAGKLRQLLLNVIDNALKFTPSGGEIRVEVQRRGATVQAVVSDTGPGVAPEDVERIFERFASDRSRVEAGTGLGLAIARAIARSHGGELRVSSGPGAAFTCELPVSGEPTQDSGRESSEAAEASRRLDVRAGGLRPPMTR